MGVHHELTAAEDSRTRGDEGSPELEDNVGKEEEVGDRSEEGDDDAEVGIDAEASGAADGGGEEVERIEEEG